MIEPDTGAPQEMGDDSLEVTEEMMDQANDKRSEAMAAVSDGTFRHLIHLIHHKCYLITQLCSGITSKKLFLFNRWEICHMAHSLVF